MSERVCASSRENGSSMSSMHGLEHEAARERDAAAHAAGELVGKRVLEAGEPDELERVAARGACARARGVEPASSANSTLRSAVRHGSSRSSWNM